VLDALKSSPVTRRDAARLAHHAHASGDREALLEYAPAAARQASAAGAHRESMAFYALALRFGDELPSDDHALMLEAYSRECNLTERQMGGSPPFEARWKSGSSWEILEAGEASLPWRSCCAATGATRKLNRPAAGSRDPEAQHPAESWRAAYGQHAPPFRPGPAKRD
jgi:hypothetical protein